MPHQRCNEVARQALIITLACEPPGADLSRPKVGGGGASGGSRSPGNCAAEACRAP